MIGLTTSWKAFRVASIIQLVLVALQAMLELVDLFFRGSAFWYPLSGLIVYGVIFYFVYIGLSLLNYNFPDVPLTDKQKQTFNRLFIINFILIAYLFAKLVNNWWIIPLLVQFDIDRLNLPALLGPLLLTVIVFILHLVFLGGMIRLRRVIYRNTIANWVEQFDDPGRSN